jgi:hypothetical protein
MVRIDVGIDGTLKCQSETDGDFACEFISFGGLNQTKNAQCDNIEGKDNSRRIFIRPYDFDDNNEFIFPKDPTAVEVCVGPEVSNLPSDIPSDIPSTA